MKTPNLRPALRVARSAIPAMALMLTATVPTPAAAQFGGVVFDPSNYAQNVLTAARTLAQINNQIRMLQNQATALVNQAKNLASLPSSILAPLDQQIRTTQSLIASAQKISFDVNDIETKYAAQYKGIDLTASDQALVAGAEARWQTSVAAFEDALKVQAGAVGHIEGARASIDQLVSASQSASGALQAAQAGNQLLALQSQQLADLTATLAALGRAQALDAAGAATAKAQAHEQLRRFLSPGAGYVSAGAQLFHP